VNEDEDEHGGMMNHLKLSQSKQKWLKITINRGVEPS
jgi:hypothetical protein